MKKYREQFGVSGLIEICMVLAIASLLFLIVLPQYKKLVERNKIKAGIHQLYNIKKTMEAYVSACRGYPWVAPSKSSLVDVIDCCSIKYGTGNKPVIYPDEVQCDTTTFQSMVPGIIYDDNNPNMYDACDYTDLGCVNDSNAAGGINRSFVKAPGTSDTTACESQFGWTYRLVPGPNVLIEPTAVYCGAVGIFNGEYAIVLIDSKGGGQQKPEGSEGDFVANDCACGAWCYESMTGSAGCCNNCDGSGNFAIPVRY